MSIESEIFYRAVCDHEGCLRTLPDENEDYSHLNRKGLEELLNGDPEDSYRPPWVKVGEQTFCPRHAPGARECAACEGRGFLITIREDGRPQWGAVCDVCDYRGYFPTPAGGDH